MGMGGFIDDGAPVMSGERPLAGVAPYGAWPSPLGAEQVAAASTRIASPRGGGERVHWLEGRPAEGGRVVVVRSAPGEPPGDLTPPGFSVRSRVHEYGGGAYAVSAGVVYFVQDADQRVYRQDGPGGAAPVPLTPAGPWRHADLVPDPPRGRLLGVREALPPDGGEPRSAVVAIAMGHHRVSPLPCSELQGKGLTPSTLEEGRVLVEGPDFLASPRPAPDGSRLAWIAWSHPHMPWDAAELWLAELDGAGQPRAARQVAGGPGESVFQPEWGPDGSLYFVSERSGWWNLYRWRSGVLEALAPMQAECGLPQWAFGMRTYAVLGDGTIACACAREGTWRLVRIDPRAGTLAEVATPFTVLTDLAPAGDRVLAVASGPAASPAVVRVDPSTGAVETLRPGESVGLGDEWLSRPEPLRFPTAGGGQAFGFYYPPRNPRCQGPAGERPPLIVRCHGGPTAAAAPTLDLTVQFWTTRGFAFADVNYAGSTGYGRAYRERLSGGWGVVDVADCVAAAEFLAARGDVDRTRMAVRGSSAGGFTALCALTGFDTFRAGAIYCGVTDLEALARDTHKLEAHYLDRLVGPYPEARNLYRARSPLSHTAITAFTLQARGARLAFFQGLEDRVVPPDQTARMAEALRARGVPVAYHAFPGEGHGFRRAETLVTALAAELALYGEAFGFTPAAG
jgi:dipeptidyl aminopeptidase/acylaminoacyl peptidase